MNAPNVVKAGASMVALAIAAAGLITFVPPLFERQQEPPAVAAASTPAAKPLTRSIAPVAAMPQADIAPTVASAAAPNPEIAAAKKKLNEALARPAGPSDNGLSQIARAIGAPPAKPATQPNGALGFAPPAQSLASIPPAPIQSAPSLGTNVATTAQPAPSPAADEVAELCARAKAQLQDGAVSSARLLLTRAARSGDAQPLHMLAQTYDAKALAAMGVTGIRTDPATAKRLYAKAAASGSDEAKRRLAELQR